MSRKPHYPIIEDDDGDGDVDNTYSDRWNMPDMPPIAVKSTTPTAHTNVESDSESEDGKLTFKVHPTTRIPVKSKPLRTGDGYLDFVSRRCTKSRFTNRVVFCCVLTAICAICLLVVVSISTTKRIRSSGAPAGVTVLPITVGTLGIQTTAIWRQLAARIKNNTDATANPCTDFYQYACGGWLASHDIPDYSARIGSFDAVQQAIEVDLFRIATAGWPVIGTWYSNCMDTATRNAVGAASLDVVLEAVMAVNSTQTLAAAVAEMHLLGVDALFSVYLEISSKNVSQFHLTVGHPESTLSHDTLTANRTASPLADAQLTALNVYASKLFASMPAYKAQPYRVALVIEADIAAASMDSTTMRNLDRTTNPTTRAGLKALVPHFDWDTYWNTLVLESGATWSKGVATLDDVVGGVQRLNLLDPTALSYIETLVRATDTQNAWQGMRSYLVYRVLAHYAQYMPTAQADLAARFGAAASGVSTPAPRVMQCLDSLNAALGDVMSHYYVAKYFPEDSKAAAQAMVANIIAAFKTQIEQIAWMDAPTKQAALQKLAAIKPLIGYPTTWSSDTVFDVHTGQYLESVLEWQYASAALQLQALEATPNRYEWMMHTYEVNAYYDPEANDIVFPAGILQGTFFNASAPLAMNYGAIGSVIGHELSHGFDDQGRQFDASGNRRDWWSAASNAAFKTHAQCVADLYSSFESPAVAGEFVDGQLTLGENLADIGGLRASHTALLNVVQSGQYYDQRSEVATIFEGNTQEQLFYRAWAGVWCEKRAPALAFRYLHEDPHSPPKWRVNGPASQSREFADVWKCKPGVDAMAPLNTCSVW